MAALVDVTAARRAKAELKLELRAKRADAARAERAARDVETRRRRAAQAEDRRQARAGRTQRRVELAASVGTACRRVLPAVPVLMVSVFAVCGQIGAIFTYPPDGTPWLARVVIAVGAAVTLETIANYVAHQGHKALLAGAETEAARRRYAAYAVALLVALINYSHFSGDGFAPTPAAAMFALFSAAQPWLWGLHTRRELHGLLVRQGKNDDPGAVFSAARWRHFPWRTWLARRYSIANGASDPRQAWTASEAERLARRAARALQLGRPTLEQKVALLVTLTRLAAPKLRQRRDDVTPAVADTNQRSVARAGSNRSPFLENPPAKAIELAQSGLGKVRLQKAVLKELGTPITPHEARVLLEQHRPTNNGHKVPTP